MKANGTRARCSIVLGASCALPPVCPSVLPLPLTLSSFHLCVALHAITLLCLVLLQRDPQLQIIRDEKRDRKILLPAHDLGHLLPMHDICCNNVLLWRPAMCSTVTELARQLFHGSHLSDVRCAFGGISVLHFECSSTSSSFAPNIS